MLSPKSRILNAQPPASIMTDGITGIDKAKSGFPVRWNSEFLYQTEHLECSRDKS